MITAVDGQGVSAPADVSGALLTRRPGDTVSIDLTSQDGASQSATVTLASGPAQ